MKTRMTRTLAALLAALMLLCAIPFAGVAADEAASEKSTVTKLMQLGTENGNTGLGGTFTWYNLTTGGKGKGDPTHSAPTLKESVITENGMDYIHMQSYIPKGADASKYAIEQMIPSGNFSAATQLSGDRTSFTFQISLAQNDKPMPMTYRLRYARFDSDRNGTAHDANGNVIYKDAAATTPLTGRVYKYATAYNSDFFSVTTAGTVRYNSGSANYTICNTKDGAYDISIVFNYDEATVAYLVDVYANGVQIHNDLPYNFPTAAAGDLTATGTVSGFYADGTAYSGAATYKYSAPALNAAAYANGYADGSGAPAMHSWQLRIAGTTYYGKTGTSTSSAIYNAFEDNTSSDGYCKYSIKLNNLGLSLGADTSNAMRNDYVLLDTKGQTLSETGDYYALGTSGILCAPLAAVLDGDSIVLPTAPNGWVNTTTGKHVTSLSADDVTAGKIAAYATACPEGVISDINFDDGTPGIIGINNGTTVANGVLNVVGHREAQTTASSLEYLFPGNHFRESYGSPATMTLSFSFTPKTDLLPSYNFRFRTRDNTFLTSFFSVGTTYLNFVNSNISVPVEKDVTYDITMLISVSNIYDESGAAIGSTNVITVYIDGICYGTASMKNENGAKYGTINTGANTDIRKIQGHHYEKTVYAEDRAFELDNFRTYYGIDDAYVPEIYALNGASIRVGSTADASGLRFTFGINRAWYDSLEGAEVGALILPADYAAGLSEITKESLASIKHIDVALNEFSEESTEDILYFNAAIVKLLSHNYARDFIAVGYVKVGDTYYYSSASESRSVVEVARNYVASGAVEAKHKERVKEYNDSVIYLAADTLAEVASANYSSPYTVSYNAGVILIQLDEDGVGSLSDIKSIVIGSDIYTGGWVISGNGSSLTANYTAE